MLVFDAETDGLLDTITKVHCINMIDTKTGKEYRYTDHFYYQNVDGSYTGVKVPKDGMLLDALNILETQGRLAGQNIINYDLPALKIVYPHFKNDLAVKVRDTKVMSQLMYPTLKDKDFAAVRKGRLPQEFLKKGLAGRHSLEAWGIRIGGELKQDFNPKDYGHTWATMPFTQVMDDYCMQDVRTSVSILNFMEERAVELTTDDAIDLEMDVARIISRQERHGWLFDKKGAEKLTHKLQIRKVELEDELRKVFPPFFVRAQTKTFVPKRDNKRMFYTAGAPITKVKQVMFNPGSRDHIANRLITLYKWEPVEFTSGGKPEINETVLKGLPYAEAELLSEYLMVAKRLSQVSDGRQGWLKKVHPDGRMYGKINTLGCVTGRMSHYGPNIAQVPKNAKPYGKECRALFGVCPGYKQVGVDADSLEARMMGHYMAKWDNNDYANSVISGNKEDKTDNHSVNQFALGFNVRENAKTWLYAFLYGAGNYTLGATVVKDFDEEKLARFYAKYPAGSKRSGCMTRLGQNSKGKISDGIPALGKLIAAVKKAARRGWVIGLDGRRIYVRSAHAALNTLLQGAGALVMKRALVILDAMLQQNGLLYGIDYEFTGNIHDEIQIEVGAEHAEEVARCAEESIRLAGEYYTLRCALAGRADIGNNWSETH